MTETETLTKALHEERAAVCAAAGVDLDDLPVIEDAAVKGEEPGRASALSRSGAWGARGRVLAAVKRMAVDDIRRLVWLRNRGASRG